MSGGVYAALSDESPYMSQWGSQPRAFAISSKNRGRFVTPASICCSDCCLMPVFSANSTWVRFNSARFFLIRSEIESVFIFASTVLSVFNDSFTCLSITGITVRITPNGEGEK